MKSIKIRYLESRPIAGGRVAYYYNPPRKARQAGILERMPLGTDLAEAIQRTEDMNKIWDEWRVAVRSGGELNERNRRLPGSVADLFDRYKRSSYYTDKAAKTREDYAKCLRTLEATELRGGRRLGNLPAKEIDYPHADKLYELLRERHGLSYANAMMRVARRVFGLGIRWNIVKINPFSRMQLKALPARKVRWTAEQMQTFADQCIVSGSPSIALMMYLAYWTAQRVVDCRNLKWKNLRDGVFYIKQSKTGTELQIPAGDEILEILGQPGEADEPLVKCETTGRAWGASHLTHKVREICRAAGLPDELRLSDMRRTALTEMGEAGATDDELISVSGHLTRQMLSVYSVSSRNKAESAMQKRRAAKSAE